MKKVAFVTYNTLSSELSSGWHDGPDGRQALLVQNTRGQKWGAREDPQIPSGENRVTNAYVDRVRDEISDLWGQLQTALPELDHVVVYVGSKGSERAIALSAQLPASKVTFVSCDCGLPAKEVLIQAAGMAAAKLVLCECGGHRTMEKLYLNFMETGKLR